MYSDLDCDCDCDCVCDAVKHAMHHATHVISRCPKPVLPVFCTGAGFELLGRDGVWRLPAAVSLAPGGKVILSATSHVATDNASSNPGRSLTDTIVYVATEESHAPVRVRYAYADWPVSSVRNLWPEGSGLPARLFDILVVGFAV